MRNEHNTISQWFIKVGYLEIMKRKLTTFTVGLNNKAKDLRTALQI